MEDWNVGKRVNLVKHHKWKNVKKKIKVFAPGSVSNIGSGYDIMGFTFEGSGDILELELNESMEISMQNLSGIDIPLDDTNVVYPGLKKMMESINSNNGVHVRFLQKISPGSGIGSSAASSVAAVFGYNKLAGSNFSHKQLIEFAMEGEKLVSGQKHADNVAPCMLGGFTLVRSYNPLDIINIPYPEDLICTIVHPDIKIKTSESRLLIKELIPIKDTVTQCGNAASLIAGLILNDKSLIGRSVQDVIAEPARAALIPSYHDMKNKVYKEGALAFNISGSGPSVFAFSESHKTGNLIGKTISEIFQSHNIKSKIYISPISSLGVREII